MVASPIHERGATTGIDAHVRKDGRGILTLTVKDRDHARWVGLLENKLADKIN
jgi:hypothetical protein